MAGRTVLVTGASTGIGLACAARLDAAGWRVYAGVRSDAAANTLREAGSERLEPVILDVTQPDHITTVARRIIAETNGHGLDGLVNNAGDAVGGPLEYLDLDTLRAQFELNVIAPVALVQALREPLRAAQGRIVMMGSIASRVSGPNLGPYSASKHALAALAESLRAELQPAGIKVALIEPGAVNTPIWNKGSGQLDDLTKSLPPDATERYAKLFKHTAKVLAKSAEHGVDPDRVAKAVERALTARFPKSRYLVGPDAIAAGTVLRVLPDRLRAPLVRYI